MGIEQNKNLSSQLKNPRSSIVDTSRKQLKIGESDLATNNVPDEIIKRFMKVGTATLYSATNSHGYSNCFMTGINCYTPGKRIVGRARTLSYIPSRPDIEEETNLGESSPEYRAMGSSGPGDILVVGTHGNVDKAIAGDMILLHLKMGKAEGLVTDGGIRDLPAIKEYGYGIFAGGITPAGRAGITSVADNIDIVCGGITVRPGDIIVAQDHDIICIPHQLAEQIIDWAEEHEEFEDVVKSMILEENCPPGRYYNAETFERLARERGQK